MTKRENVAQGAVEQMWKEFEAGRKWDNRHAYNGARATFYAGMASMLSLATAPIEKGWVEKSNLTDWLEALTDEVIRTAKIEMEKAGHEILQRGAAKPGVEKTKAGNSKLQ